MKRRDLLTLAMACVTTGMPRRLAGRTNTPQRPDEGGMMGDEHDFDFLYRNDWKVENRVLRGRLVGSEEWDSFEGTLEDVKPILNGLGNVDRFSAVRGGREFHATSLRIFDPNEKIWRIYWADTYSYKMTYQVEGPFVDGVGEMIGEEMFQGKMIRLRFLWTEVDTGTPHWEQAYFDEDAGEWETNWIMRFIPK